MRARLLFWVAATCSTVIALMACVNYLDADAGAHGRGDAASEASGDASCAYGAYACAVLDAGPLVYLRFDESSGQSATDLTGNGNTGMYPFAGAMLGVPGALKNDQDTAVYLDGTHGIGMPPGADFAVPMPEFTVELWVNLDADGGDLNAIGYVVDHETQGPTAPNDGWAVLLTGGSVQIAFWASGNTLGVATEMPSLIVPSQWHHIVGVCSSAEQDLWIDGTDQPMNHHIPLGPAWPKIGPWMIGNENCQCSPQGITGSIDELAIYPRALTEQEIKSHYMLATQ